MEKKKLCLSLHKENNHFLVLGSIPKVIYVVIVNTVFNKVYVTIPPTMGVRERQILGDKLHQINQTKDSLYNAKNRKKKKDQQLVKIFLCLRNMETNTKCPKKWVQSFKCFWGWNYRYKRQVLVFTAIISVLLYFSIMHKF